MLTIDRRRTADVREGDRITAIDGRVLTEPLVVTGELAPVRPGAASGIPVRNRLGTETEWFLYPDTQVEQHITVERPDVPLDRRIADLASAVAHKLAGEHELLQRASNIADDLEAEHPALAFKLRSALAHRSDSATDRSNRIRDVRDDLVRLTAPPKRVQRRTRHGLTLVSGGGGSWYTEDGGYVILYDDSYITYCENPHPVRYGKTGRRVLERELREYGSPRFVAQYGAEALTALRSGSSGYWCPGDAEHNYGLWTAWKGDSSSEPVTDRYGRLEEAWSELAQLLAHRQDS